MRSFVILISLLISSHSSFANTNAKCVTNQFQAATDPKDKVATAKNVKVDPTIFRAYDVRDLAGPGKPFNAETAEAIGRGTVLMLKKQFPAKKIFNIGVGADFRLTSPELKTAYIKGIRDAGGNVTDLQNITTPESYWASKTQKLDAVGMITASHNPKEYNGLKLSVEGEAIFGEKVQDLYHNTVEAQKITRKVKPGKLTTWSPHEDYLNAFVKDIEAHSGPKPFRGLHVAIDTSNGAASPIAQKLFERLGAKVTMLNDKPDGNFPGHPPDPSVPANIKDLADYVKEHHLDMGIAFDGDADRFVGVDDEGKILPGWHSGAIVVEDLAKTHPGKTVVMEIKTTSRFFDIAKKAGLKTEISGTGAAGQKDAMLKDENIIYSGESGSGHHTFNDGRGTVNGGTAQRYDDGLYMAARVLEIRVKRGIPISKMTEKFATAFETPEIGYEVPDSIKFKLVDEVNKLASAKHQNILNTDGVRVNFDKGFALVRASNTEPKLTLKFEAATQEKLDEVQAEFMNYIKQAEEKLNVHEEAATEAQINMLAKEGLGSDEKASTARSQLKEALKLDDLNFTYFWSVYQKAIHAKEGKSALEIFEEGRNTPGADIAYPTAIAPPEMMAQLPHVEYSELAKNRKEYEAAAKTSVLWIKKMHAGTGSSMDRISYLSKQLKIPEKDIHMGAKGTDLYVTVPDPAHRGKTLEISLVEAQLLQAIHDANEGHFDAVAFQDILGSETQESVRNIWNKKSLLDPTKTYAELVEANPKLMRVGETFQAYIPTLNENGQITFNRTAPGGHALFGVDAIRASYLKGALPPTGGKHLVSVIGNGEDLSSTPDPLMVGYMVENDIAIVMVTTEKTANDLKGGQIALVKGKDGKASATIIEQAQAKEAGQLELFEKLGLDVKRGDQKAFFNTNMALFNYDVLQKKTARAIHDVGEEQFLKEISADFIANWKEQKDPDGVVRKYLQIEAPMGSILLNLDRFWRTHYGEPLVHFINVDKVNRTRFFSPIKSAFDYFMQFHSDRFTFDSTAMRLVNQRPGVLPSVDLKDKYYQNVQNVLDSFSGTSIKDLKSLHIEGEVGLKNMVLRGNVSIVNKTGSKTDLSEYVSKHPELQKDSQGRVILDNVNITLVK